MAEEAVLLEIKQIGEDLNKEYAKLEGMVKEKASEQSIKDIEVQIKGAESKYDEVEKNLKAYKEQIDQMAVRLNRESAGLGDYKEMQKNLEAGIYEQLESGVKSGVLVTEGGGGNHGFKVKNGHFALHRKAVGIITTGNLTDGAGNAAFSAREISQTVITEPTPKVRVRQLISSAVMSEGLREYPQFVGGEGSPDYQVTQGSKKAVVDYDWVMKQITPKIIAATADISATALADIGWLANFLSTQMLQDLLTKEDTELLYGAGGSSAIHGLVPRSTAYVKDPGITVDSLYDVLVDSAAQLEESEYTASGYLLHPRDYAKMLIYKSTTKEYNHPVLVFNGQLTVGGVQVFKATQIAKGTGLVADWSQASLLVREGMTFNVSYENKDNFEKNMVSLRIEERIALAMYRPKGFINFTTAGGYVS